MCKTIFLAAIFLIRSFSTASQEKIYIQFDKEHYAPGETIWFKAYVMGADNSFSASNNFYLMLSDSRGEIITVKRQPVVASSANGEILLPASLNTGAYFFTAITGAMLADSSPLVYKKEIFISGIPGAENIFIRKGKEIRLNFYPESGKLIKGIRTVVGFKVTDEWGSPVAVKGNLVDSDTATLLSFMSDHDGIGRFEFKPKAGKKYIAEIETPNGIKKYPLPQVFPSGVSLNIQDEASGKKILLTRSAPYEDALDSLELVASINGHIVYRNEIIWDGYVSAVSHIITDSLPSGILQFVLYNKKMQPLAERTCFVDNGEYRSAPSCKINKTGGEVTVDFVFPDSVTRNFSVAVTDYNHQQEQKEENIWSALLLSKYLSKPVNNLARYFQQENTVEVKLAMDNLMLVDSIHRFGIKDLTASVNPERVKDPFLINISGDVLSQSTKKPVKGGELTLFFPGPDSALLYYIIDVSEAGRFNIDSLNIAGTVKVYYSYKNKTGEETPVVVAPGKDTALRDIVKLLSGYSGTGKKDLAGNDFSWDEASYSKVKLLDSVVVVANQQRPAEIINKRYTSEIFRTGGKIKIDNINNPPVDKSMNGLDFVLNRITTIGVQHGTFVNRKNFSLQDNKPKGGSAQGPKTTVASTMRFWEVGLFINEIPADLLQLQLLRADQIAMVKFFEAGAIASGSVYPGGAVAVYLNYGAQVPGKTKQMNFFEYAGYSAVKKFLSQEYPGSAEVIDNKENPATLYWKPDIYMETGLNTAQVKFYTGDAAKKMKLILTGIDNRGRLIYLEKIIE